MAEVLDFLNLVGRLKTEKRTGWQLRDVPLPESVADHQWRMAMAAFLAPARLDRDRCIKMALVHDLAEAIVGDLAPADGVPAAEKQRREEAAMEEILGACPGAAAAQELRALWAEYEARESPEAVFVKDLDLLEMLVQADEYERANPGMELGDFFASTEGRFRTPEVEEWQAGLRARRASRLSSSSSSS